MTWEEAADEFAASINDRDVTNPVVIKRVDDAKAALAPFLTDGKMPLPMVQRIKEYVTNAGSK